MEKIKLDIVGLSYSQTQSGAYALVLGESSGKRRLPIIIGGFEAQAIAIELEQMTPSRPLTHDLFKNFADEFDIHIQEVIIYNLVEGIFFAKLICEQKSDNNDKIKSLQNTIIAIESEIDDHQEKIWVFRSEIEDQTDIIKKHKDLDSYKMQIDKNLKKLNKSIRT